MKPATAKLILTLLAVLVASASLLTLGPPAPAPGDAPPESFSATRALGHLEEIARAPHAVGTEEHDRVRRHLAAELEGLGLTAEIQEATVVQPRPSGVIAAVSVENLVARLPGREPGGAAVLLMSHYDTVPTSPGAADDGAGVAAMLETVRALREGPELRNDVLVLFTDAEEPGLLGARAFAEQHPWARDVGMVLNFEARGVTGPSIMFETSPGNGRLIGAFRSAPRPVAASYSYEIYKVLPNDTDFSIFRRLGTPGLNFAFIEGPTGYHTALDALDRLDPGSLQHHGDYALALARRFGDADLRGDWRSPDAVYFNLFGSYFFVSYPGSLALPLAGLLSLLVVVLLVVGFRRGRLSAGRLIASPLAILLGAAVVGGLMFLLMRPLFGRYNFDLGGGWTSHSLALLGLALLAVGVTLALYRLWQRIVGADALVAGGLFLWALLSVIVAVVAPGASFLFALPALAALPAAWAWMRERPEESVATGLLVTLGLAVVAAALFWPVHLSLVGAALAGPAAILVGLFAFLLLVGLLTPLLALVARPRRSWLAPLGWILVGVALIVAARLGSGFGPDNPRPDSVLYALDAETGEARWMSLDSRPDGWTEQFLSGSPERGTLPGHVGFPRPALIHEAPALPLAGGRVAVLSEHAEGARRTVELRVDWPDFDPHVARIFLRSEAEIAGLSVAGEAVGVTRDLGPGSEPNRRMVLYYAPPPAGVELEVELVGEQPLVVETVGQRLELPELPDFPHDPRPDHLIPRPDWTTDSTFVRAVAEIVPGASVEGGEPEGGEESSDGSDGSG